MRIDGRSPVGFRLASRFLIELGRPPQHDNEPTLTKWAATMESLLVQSRLGYDEFREFLMWVCRDHIRYGNPWTAENLRIARDPCASLHKQFDQTFKRWEIKKKFLAESEYEEWLEAKQEKDEYGWIREEFAALADQPCPDCQTRPYREDDGQMLCEDCWHEANEPEESYSLREQG